MKQWIFSLTTGEAALAYPSGLRGDDEDYLIEWLTFVLGVLKKRRAAAVTVGAIDPLRD